MAAAATAPGPDPVLELMGWKAEPLLRRRLKVYILESSVEFGSLVASIYISQANLSPASLFARLLMLPMAVAALKLIWTLRLAFGYYMARRRNVAEAIQRMSTVHSRSFWSCSAAALTCLSCVLMVWHAIIFLLMTGYGGSPTSRHEEFAAKFLLVESAVFVVVNWLIWRDFVNHYKDAPDEPDDIKLLYQILHLHRCKAIKMVKYSTLAQKEVMPTSCVVCLEEFADSELVAQLPCGHTFHPTCAHKWIMEDWRCPFRCSLDASKLGEEATHPQSGSMATEETVDLEVGGHR